MIEVVVFDDAHNDGCQVRWHQLPYAVREVYGLASKRYLGSKLIVLERFVVGARSARLGYRFRLFHIQFTDTPDFSLDT